MQDQIMIYPTDTGARLLCAAFLGSDATRAEAATPRGWSITGGLVRDNIVKISWDLRGQGHDGEGRRR
jgi:hypothetical protein